MRTKAQSLGSHCSSPWVAPPVPGKAELLTGGRRHMSLGESQRQGRTLDPGGKSRHWGHNQKPRRRRGKTQWRGPSRNLGGGLDRGVAQTGSGAFGPWGGKGPFLGHLQAQAGSGAKSKVPWWQKGARTWYATNEGAPRPRYATLGAVPRMPREARKEESRRVPLGKQASKRGQDLTRGGPNPRVLAHRSISVPPPPTFAANQEGPNGRR